MALVGFIFWMGRLSEKREVVEEEPLPVLERGPIPEARPIPVGAVSATADAAQTTPATTESKPASARGGVTAR